jgi:dTDP-glucose 4,6-dehydratase
MASPSILWLNAAGFTSVYWAHFYWSSCNLCATMPDNSVKPIRLGLADMTRVLVTGGAGFIGSWLVRYLLNTHPDWSVVNLDVLDYAGNLDNLTDVDQNPRYSFVHGDIRDKALVTRLMGQVDYCINVAAQTHVDRSISGPETFVSTNVVGTMTLLEAARHANISRFVQISTDEVYGSLGESGLFTEQSPIEPSSPYSSSKAGADLLALSYYRTYGLPVCVTRCSNNYGPNQYPEKLIPYFIMQAQQDKALPVYGDGQNVRDWIYVEDHNRAIDLVLTQGQPGEVYNIGSSNEWNNLDITKALLRHLGKPESLITYVADRLGHDRRYAIDSSKIQTELGWKPLMSFDQGLSQTIQWYLDNTQWLERLQNRKQTPVAAV